MEKEIKLYTYVDGINDTPFPNEREQIVIANFKYDANRMGDAPSIEATAMHRLCLDNLWTDNVYAEFNGEKYFIMNTPSSNKSNEDERYEHELILKSEREVLNHVYFIDAVQGDSGLDQVKSNSTKVQFMGDIKQFVERLNASLSYTKMEYTAVIDEGITSEDKMVEFEDQYVLQALQEIYNVYELPYYFDGKTIHVGYEKNAITTPFKYGYDEALLSVSKENANYKVVNRCSGYGSEENIPYYYPNNSPKGDASVRVVSGNISADKFVIYDYEKFVANMSPTDTCSVRKEQEGDIYKFVWSVGEKDIELSDIGVRLASGVIPTGNESFTQTLEAQIPYSQYLMPPVYRETKGKERFYNAKNDTYPVPDGENYYIFENEYSEKNPDEMIVEFSDIKPTIKGITNSQGQRIDMFLDFAYDQNDNDEVDSEGNYVHPYFFAKLRKTDGEFGFNLFDHASENQTMQISFTSGVCGSCTFEIGVGEETNQNIVQVDDSGNLKRDENGNVLWENQSPQPRQNDTQNYEVWIALKKDDTTYTNVMPNASMYLKPSTSDTFVILGINLPQAYITAAEKTLKEEIIKYMWMNNSEKFNFSIKFSRIYFAEHPEVLELLNENSRLIVEYNGTEYTFYVDNFTYTMDGSSSLPEIEVNLVDTLTIGKNSLETAISEIKQDILSTLGGGDILKQGLKYFLRKDTDDVAKGKITFRKGIDVGSFSSLVSGGTFRIDADGKSYIEVDKLLVRMKAIFEELQIKKVSYIGGEQYVTPASMEVKRVEEGDTYYRCYATEDDSTPYEMEFAVGDQALSKMADLSSGTDVSNRYYWRLVSNVGKNYIDLSKNDADSLSDIPQVGDVIVSLGNRSEKDRQNAIIISSVSLDAPSIKMLQGIDSFSLEGKDMISQGFDTSTNRAFLKIFGDLFAGDPDNTTYIKYDSVGKELEVKGKFITRGGTDIDTALSNIQDQIDGNIETWFYDPEPTLENEPAVNWTTPTEKDKHLGDLYYSGEGKAYRFQKDGDSYIWKLIQDTDITKALEEAKKAQEAASSAQNTANEAKESVSDLNTYVDGAFKDGVVTEAEAIAIEKYQNSVNETKKSVQGTYNTLYSNVYLEGSAKTELKSAYDSLISSIDTLLSKISSAIADGKASVQEKNEVDIAYAAFNDKMEAYDTAVEKANKAIQDKLKSYSDEAMDAIAGYEYLKEAFKNDTTIEGGVVSTSIVYTGHRNTQGKFVPMSGINGVYLEDASKGHGISYWAGGNIIDRETYSNPEDIPADAATAVIRMDGSGYFANGNLTWTKEGILHADPLSFFVGEEMVGDILKLFAPIYDESDGTTVIGIQAKYPMMVAGGVTMYSGSPLTPSDIFKGLVLDPNTLKWNEKGQLTVIGGTGSDFNESLMWTLLSNATTEQINISHLTDALTGYATESWVTGKNYAVKSTTLSGYGITDGINAVSVTGTGNAVTAASISGHTLTLTKGSTFSLSGHKHAWADITSGKPTTLSGYGITDAYTKTDSDNRYVNVSGDTMTGNLYFNSSDYPFFNKRNSYAFYNISLNLESRSNNYFYPVKVTSNTPSFPLCTVSISSTSGSASIPLNNNSIRFMVRSGGWGDTGKRLIVLDHWAYSSSEITIYAIYLGEEDGDCVVYLRGGVNYTISVFGRDWISSSDTILINGNEKYPKIDLSGNPTDGRSFARCYRAWVHSNGYGLGLQAENSDKLGGVSSEYFMRTKFQEGYYGMALPDGSDTTWIRTSSYGIIPYSATIKSSLGTDQWRFGNAYIENVHTITTKASDWFRSTGNTGWLNETYGGGWYMTDSAWIRAYANKSIAGYNIQGSGKVSANMGMFVYGMSGSSWGTGDGAYSVAVPNNENQTTLLLAYNGTNNNVTGSDRYFSIEVLNGENRNVRMIVQSSHLMDLTKSTVTIFGDLLVTGGGTFYSSDIRYKSIMQQVNLSLLDIANAPSFVYHWNREGMKCDRLNLGGSAQYTQSVLPWAVEDNDNFLSMDYATVAYTFAVHTARHLLTYETRTDKKIKKLENRIKYLEKQLKKLGCKLPTN